MTDQPYDPTPPSKLKAQLLFNRRSEIIAKRRGLASGSGSRPGSSAGRRPSSGCSFHQEKMDDTLTRLEEDKTIAVADFSGLELGDDDLAGVIDQVLTMKKCHTLLLADNNITDKGVEEHILPFLEQIECMKLLDISGNLGITNAIEDDLLLAAQEHEALTVDVEATGISKSVAERLVPAEGETIWADHRRELLLAAAEMKEFEQTQSELVAAWKPEENSPIALQAAELLQKQANDAILQYDGNAIELPEPKKKAAKAPAKRAAYPQTGKRKPKGKMAKGASNAPPPPPPFKPVKSYIKRQNALAFLSYLSTPHALRAIGEVKLQDDVGKWGLKWAEGCVGSTQEESKDAKTFDLPQQDCCEGTIVELVKNHTIGLTECTMHNYTGYAIGLVLLNNSLSDVKVTIPKGTVFGFGWSPWVYEQYQVVQRTRKVVLEPHGGKRVVGLRSLCMHRNMGMGWQLCLTGLEVKEEHFPELRNQAACWKHFLQFFAHPKD
eukprot:TRINITY_DN62910_c0_g2_i1.p1 TRINITY_DN62910_c0_g2~~TRINITY_DN62910_c0_g2_i1.p1  ORF type:complete len:494 (+),score=46.27 TRINITY_DN62910_c0_g2_i1:25-1506(+)